MLRWLKTLAGISDPLIAAAKAKRLNDFISILQRRSIVLLGQPGGDGILAANATPDQMLSNAKEEVEATRPESPFSPLIVDGDSGPEMLGFLTVRDAEVFLRKMMQELDKIVILPIYSIKGKAICDIMRSGIGLVLQRGSLDAVTIRLTMQDQTESNKAAS